MKKQNPTALLSAGLAAFLMLAAGCGGGSGSDSATASNSALSSKPSPEVKGNNRDANNSNGGKVYEHAYDRLPEAGSSGGGPASMVVVDKETGKLRAPTADERITLMAGFEQSVRELRKKNAGKIPTGMTRHKNGSASAVLGLKGMQLLIARTSEDGSVAYGHAAVDDEGSIVPMTRDAREVK